jgi:hypothetical protein
VGQNHGCYRWVRVLYLFSPSGYDRPFSQVTIQSWITCSSGNWDLCRERWGLGWNAGNPLEIERRRSPELSLLCCLLGSWQRPRVQSGVFNCFALLGYKCSWRPSNCIWNCILAKIKTGWVERELCCLVILHAPSPLSFLLQGLYCCFSSCDNSFRNNKSSHLP